MLSCASLKPKGAASTDQLMQAMAPSPEMTRRAKALYQSALAIDPVERPSFLDKICAGNPVLRHEVESLLSARETVTSHPAPAETPTEILSKSEILIGQSLLHYKILSLLGRGGMGEVYLAYDTKLGRNVALKLIPRSFSADEDRLKRFAREARSASALNHPNVCVIHEIGETADGRHYIAMEHIEGLTLRKRLETGSIAMDEALKITEQVAAALETAHKAGVVHRDIKPENIMVRPDGYVKVLDFGLAKLTERYAMPSDSEAATFPAFDTHSDHLLGTVNYLSPEQARRQPIDERTDIWSLGVVLYEMLCGRMPFHGETASHAIVAILEQEPEPLVESLSTVPATLERIVNKALRKNVAERYGAVGDFSSDLQTLKQELSTGSFEAAKPRRFELPQPARRAALVVLLVLVAGAVIYLLMRDRQTAPEPPPETISSVAVLPFVNTSNDPNVDYLSDGMTESLINSLSQLPNLKVIGRNSAFRYKGVQTDTPTIAKELGVQAILTGRIVERDGNISIYVDLEDARDKHHIWGDQYHRKSSDLRVLQREIAGDIIDNLRLKLGQDDRNRLNTSYTDNSEAYELYLKGRYYWNKRTEDGFGKAIAFFQKAIEKDPNYAQAYTGLADTYMLLSDWGFMTPAEGYSKAKDAAVQALIIDDRLAEAHTSLAGIKGVLDWDWPGAESEYRKAITLNPNYATAHHWYALQLMLMGRVEESLAEIKQAQRLDPLSLGINKDFAVLLLWARRYDEALEQCRKTLEIDSSFLTMYAGMAEAYEGKQMYAEAIAQLRKAHNRLPDDPEISVSLGQAFALAGMKNEARTILHELDQPPKKHQLLPNKMALLYALLGDKDKAFQILQNAYDNHYFVVSEVKVDPRFEVLRADPRYADLLRRLGL